MKSIRTIVAALGVVFSVFAMATVPALAVTNGGDSSPATYVAAFAPVFGGSGVPRSGTMSLLVRDGTISGTYSGTSVGPDYLDNRLLPVTGSVSQDQYVQLFIGGAATLRGTMAANGNITGTLTANGHLYEFVAVARPGD